jgi:CO/xanthine dehydrogenase Mo-binding subunit
MSRLHAVGGAMPKVDALDKVTGKAVYAADRMAEGMLHLRVVRSDRPHARINGLRLERARAVEGVVALWTADDLPGTRYTGPRTKDEPILCWHKVLRVGDPVVLVAAESEPAARQASELVEVAYQDLPPIFDPREALAPGAPQLHPEQPNLVFERRLVRGQADQALAESAHVVKNTYQTQGIEHAYLEPEAGFTHWEGEELVVELPTKHAHFEQNELSAVLDLPVERIRVICRTIGGYFGDKQCLSPAYYAAIATRITGRPARMVYSREESFFASTKRHPYTIQMTTGCDAGGRLTAVKVDITGDTGAYCSYAPSVMSRTIMHGMGPYRMDHVEVVGRQVRTNNPTAGSMRGFGVVQMGLAYECQMDLLAQAVGKSPEEFRRINFLQPGDIAPWGQKLSSSVGLTQCLDAVLAERGKLAPHPLESDPGYAVDWGLAAMHYGIGLTGLPNPGVAVLRAAPGAKIQLTVGTGDGGQGSSTSMVQIAAEALNLEPGEIEITSADTGLTPNSGPSTASRITYVVGRAVLEAARSLIDRVGRKLAEKWGAQPDFSGGAYRLGEKELDFKGAVDLALDGPVAEQGTFDPPTAPLDQATSQGSPYATYAFAVQAAQVAVNLKTGQARVLRLLAAHDVGKVIHRVNAEGQVHGGAVMGLGYGLMEEIVLKEGRIMNPGFRAYLIPSAMEAPEMKVTLVECPEPTGPYGAKGVGEPALLPTPPAIHNALTKILGRPVKKLPVKAEDIWRIMSLPAEN